MPHITECDASSMQSFGANKAAMNGTSDADLENGLTRKSHKHQWQYWWFSARLQYLQCISNGDTAILHSVINMAYLLATITQTSWNSFWNPFLTPLPDTPHPWQDTATYLKLGTWPPTNRISIEFKIQSDFAMLWFKMCSTDHNKMLHTSRQCYCYDVCKSSLWSVEYIMKQRIHWIKNSIEISLVGWAPDLQNELQRLHLKKVYQASSPRNGHQVACPIFPSTA